MARPSLQPLPPLYLVVKNASFSMSVSGGDADSAADSGKETCEKKFSKNRWCG